MARTEYLNVKFSSEISNASNCMCDACHNLGKVIKLELPVTKYHDGKRLTTEYSNYWLCFNCREKLTNALIWGEEDENKI